MKYWKRKHSINPEKEEEIREQVGRKNNCLMVNMNTNTSKIIVNLSCPNTTRKN